MRQRTAVRRVADRLDGKGEKFGDRVRHWQQTRNLGDQELAGKAGVTVEFLTQIKNESPLLSESLRRKLAKGLQVTVAELAGDY